MTEAIFLLVKRVWDVWHVADHKEVSVDFALNRYLADVEKGESADYNTGMENYDFAAVKAEWDALNKEEQTDAIGAYKDFVGEHYDEICAAWEAKDEAAIQTLINAFVDKYSKSDSEEESAEQSTPVEG